MSKSIRAALAVTTALVLASAPHAASAASSAVDQLIKQAQFWQSKGRADLAAQAYNRVLSIDPDNAEAKAALAKAQAPKPAPVAPAKTDAAAPGAPATAQGAAAVKKAPPKDEVGPIREAGFNALNKGDLNAAADKFQDALRRKADDADSLGGLGVVRLRQEKFKEAGDLLTRASAGGSADKWADALKSASFYADLRDAQQAVASGDDKTAEALARGLIARGDDQNNSAKMLLADLLQAEGRYAEAATYYQALAQASQGAAAVDYNSKAVRAQAQQALAGGDRAAAEKLYQTGVTTYANDPWIRYDYARFLLSEQQTSRAMGLIGPLRNSDQPESRYAAALVLAQAGQPADAAALMQKISADKVTAPMRELKLRLDVSQAVLRAKKLYAVGRTPEAVAVLQSFTTMPSLPVPALSELADQEFTIGQHATAAVLAKRAAAMPRVDPESYAGLMVVFGHTGQDNEADALLGRLSAAVGAQNPNIGRLKALYASAAGDRLRLAGQYATAYDVLQTASVAQPNDPDLLSATARLYQAGNFDGQAAQVYEMLVKTHPQMTDAWLGLAQTSVAAGNRARAHEAAAEAVKQSPDSADTYLAAAKVEETRGDKHTALIYLRQAQVLLAKENMLVGGTAFASTNPFANKASPFTNRPLAPAVELADATPVGPQAIGNAPQTLAPTRVRAMAAAQPTPDTIRVAAQDPTPRPLPIRLAALDNDDPAPSPQEGRPFRSLTRIFTAEQPVQRTDPVLSQVDQEINGLSEHDGPNVTVSINDRSRSGESGLSQLNEVTADITAHRSIGNAKLDLTAQPVFLEAGALSSSALARFGSNATPEAQGIVARLPSVLIPADAQQGAGVAFEAKLQNGPLTLEAGSTPVGFKKLNAEGAIRLQGEVAENTTAGVYVERKPVTDSVLSYAGAKDPVTGLTWGSVMRSQVGLTYAYASNGFGAYAELNGRAYDGERVATNYAGELNAGGYYSLWSGAHSTATLGINLNLQGYKDNQDFFTFGYGGYFSPRSFADISVPLRISATPGRWTFGLNLAPGVQNFSEGAAPIYGTSPAAQHVLDVLKLADRDVRSTYESIGKSGFAMAGGAEASYPLRPGTRLLGDVDYNSFGNFNELKFRLSIRQTVGSGDQ